MPLLAPSTASAASDPAQQMFGLINQDRAQNGLPALAFNSTAAAIAGGASHNACGSGLTIHGRAQDMVERGYMDHPIPPCGVLIFPTVAAAGVQMSAWGETIGEYTAGYDPATNVNQMWMASPAHRQEVLGAFNQVGVGAYTGHWVVGGQDRGNVTMFAAIFFQSPSGPAAAPPPAAPSAPPAPRPAAPRPAVAAPVSAPIVAAPALSDAPTPERSATAAQSREIRANETPDFDVTAGPLTEPAVRPVSAVSTQTPPVAWPAALAAIIAVLLIPAAVAAHWWRRAPRSSRP